MNNIGPKIDPCGTSALLLGDKGPEVFYEVQKNVVQTLEDKYYQPFIISDYYKEMLNAIESEEGITEVDSCNTSEDRPGSGDSVTSASDSALNVGDHSNYARRKLDQLQEKLNNKTQVGIIARARDAQACAVVTLGH